MTLRFRLLLAQIEYRPCDRKAAQLLLGFPGNSANFSDWLRDHECISSEGVPNPSLIQRGFMTFNSRTVYKANEYDSSNYPAREEIYHSRRGVMNVHKPLFTKEGINYFKELLANPELLTKETALLKEEYVRYYTTKYDNYVE